MSADLYISVDVEADGPIPGPYSMLAFGMAVAGDFNGEVFRVPPTDQSSFYRELKPISDRFDAEALRVSGLDRDRLQLEGVEPDDAMREASAWIVAQAGDRRPVLVGYPVVFDWMFLHWYFVNFAGDSPFGFSSALDIKTMVFPRFRRHLTAWVERLRQGGVDATYQASIPTRVPA
ncbi:MAG: hypothetical protein WA687_08180 [Solirubrobacterales bacterium]